MFNLQATWDIWIWFDELHNNVVGTSWGLNEKEFQKFACGLPYLISPKWRQAATKILVSIGSSCGLLPGGTEPQPDPMLTEGLSLRSKPILVRILCITR